MMYCLHVTKQRTERKSVSANTGQRNGPYLLTTSGHIIAIGT